MPELAEADYGAGVAGRNGVSTNKIGKQDIGVLANRTQDGRMR